MTPTCSRETTIDFRTLSIGNIGFDGFEKFPDGFFTPDVELSLEFKQLKANYVCIEQKIPKIKSVKVLGTYGWIDIRKHDDSAKFEFTFLHTQTKCTFTIKTDKIIADG